MAEEATPLGPPGRGLSRDTTRPLLGAKALCDGEHGGLSLLTDLRLSPSPPAAAALVAPLRMVGMVMTGGEWRADPQEEERW